LYSPALMEKPRVLVLTKADLVPEAERDAVARRVPGARLISAHSGSGLSELLEALWRPLAALPVSPAPGRADRG